MGYTSAKVKLIQSWRYKTLTVIKRHKTTYLFITAPMKGILHKGRVQLRTEYAKNKIDLGLQKQVR